MFIPFYDQNPRTYVRRQYVTWVLIVVNVLVFLILEAGGEAPSVAAAAFGFGAVPALFGTDALPGLGYLTLVTYAFVHGDFWHLGGNMLFLWVFGDNVEDALGHVRFLAFYLLCAIAAALLHIAMLPASAAPMIGASGAIAGIVAAYLMLHPHVRIWVLLLGRIPVPLRAYWVLGAWIVFQIVMVLQISDDSVAWWSHIGGLAAGALLILVMRRPGVALFDRAR
ncbi:membrane associated rhomboid family serine protease [Breoghania corrubedonensis]|uniref:Membrane associated rhomboid family serine protease n=1 Tax=Breoghania corrubedonensis TaxID=665038 RepID=A0A2T5VI01_9HYPH|nr:rhomboid family intramembrane serine protease [Breoghania corrubedonensis]PTW63374.1 membrane associated rhomboid family serine protease [Breoghania corrubedonensis]